MTPTYLVNAVAAVVAGAALGLALRPVVDRISNLIVRSRHARRR